MNPFETLNWWDFLVVLLGAFIRFMLVAKAKISQYKNEFNVKEYFDARHLFRWFTHLFIAFTGLLVLPSSLSSYIPNLGSWTLLGSVIIGFLGYDLVKMIEKIMTKIFKRD